MKAYLNLYRWAMEMKLRMAMYTFVAVFLKALCSLLQGMSSMEIREILTMWLVSLAFAMAESAIFPKGSEAGRLRSALWFILANVCFIGGAAAFGWFRGLPAWGGVLLVIFLQLGLGLMWFGDRFVLKMDSAQLTDQLKAYQQSRRH